MAENNQECKVTFEINRLLDSESNREVLQPVNVQYSGEASGEEEAVRNALSQWSEQMARYGIMTV